MEPLRPPLIGCHRETPLDLFLHELWELLGPKNEFSYTMNIVGKGWRCHQGTSLEMGKVSYKRPRFASYVKPEQIYAHPSIIFESLITIPKLEILHEIDERTR